MTKEELKNALDEYCEREKIKASSLIGCSNAEKREIARLNEAVDNFAENMRVRLAAKVREGYSGWSEENQLSSSDLVNKMLADVISIERDLDEDVDIYTNVLNLEEDLNYKLNLDSKEKQKLLIDIANRAMMLWFRELSSVKENKNV